MVLSAILKLDAGAFTTPLGMATEGLKGMLRIGGELSAKLGAAFSMGGGLSDLAAQTGEGAGALAVLKQAFQDTGVGAGALGQTLAMMRRSLGGVNEAGEPTGKIFKQLGLNIGELQGMGAEGQLAAIGGAIRGLKTPAQQTAAAMEVFGRSGAGMLTFLKAGDAVGVAKASLGGLPALMDRNANAFDAVADRIGRIKEKGAGMWAGIGEGLLPLAEQVTTLFDGIDLTGVGQRIGRTMGTLVQMFKDAPLGQVLKDGMMIGLGEAINWAVTGFVKLGVVLWEALVTPISYLSAAYGKAIQEVMEMIGKIPKIGKMAGLDGFKAQSFEEIRGDSKDDLVGMVDLAKKMGKIELIDVSKEKARLGEAWTAAAGVYEEKVARVQREANQSAKAGAGGGAGGWEGLKEKKDAKGGGAGSLADALGRVGGYLGGGAGGVQGRIAAWTERTARGVERLSGQMEGLRGRPVWGV